MTLHRIALGGLVVVVLGVAVAGVATMRLVARWEAPYRGFLTAEVFVQITPGSGARAIGGQVVECGVADTTGG